MQENKIVKVNNLTCIFDEKTEGETVAINNFSYEFEKNKIHFIIGNSGSGKSTLVLHFNGLLKSKKGDLDVDGFKIEANKKKIKNVKELRRKISLVFQYPEYQLFKDTIENDIAFGPKALKLHKDKFIEINTSRILQKVVDNIRQYQSYFSKQQYSSIEELQEEILKFTINKNGGKIKTKKGSFFVEEEIITKKKILHDIAETNLLRMGLDESYLPRPPFGLSGGQKRRVAIAGILAIDPNILVFDEPTAGLDPEGIDEMMKIILEAKASGKTVFVITHSMDEVLEIGDNVILLEKGNVIKSGTPYEIFKDKEVYQKTQMCAPKVIEMITKLEQKNLKFKKLWEYEPKNVEQLSEAILKLIDKKGK